MDVIATLQELGFTEYEAKVYCALVKSPGSTGYEVGGGSGVPRARVYEVLESLEKKDVVYPQVETGKQLYYPKSHSLMLHERKDRLQRITDVAQSQLDVLASDVPEPEFLVVKTIDHVLSRFRQLCRQSKHKLLVSGWPEDLSAVSPDLRRAMGRGVDVHVISFGRTRLHVPNIYYHSVPPLRHIQAAMFGRWLQAVADLEDCFIGQIFGHERTIALWSRSPALAFTVAQWIYHDITIAALEKDLGCSVREKLSDKSRDIIDRVLQWPDNSPKIVLPPNTPLVPDIFSDIEIRLNTDEIAGREAQRNAYGITEFRTTGEDPETFCINVGRGIIEVQRGPARKPDLVIEMSTEDFRAMYMGVLPLAALYVPGRVKVTGKIVSASRIQSLLRFQ